MCLYKIFAISIDTCIAFLGRKSHIKTALAFLLVQSVLGTTVYAEGGKLIGVSKSENSIELTSNPIALSSINNSQLISSLQNDAISIRQEGSAIRVRYLPGSSNLSSILRDLKSATNKLTDIQNKNALGPGSSGGGFSNYYSSYVKTVEDVAAMINQFQRMPPEVFNNYIPAQYQGILTQEKLIIALKNIRFSFFQEGLAVAPNGLTDILETDYVVNGEESYIILLKSFFEKYNSIASNDNLSFLRARTILHEVSHLFGIGIKDDRESFQFSFYLLLALATDQRYCVSTVDCKLHVSMLRKQYARVGYSEESIAKLKNKIETVLNITDLKLNALIKHGIQSDLLTSPLYFNTNNLNESIIAYIPADLKDILPESIRDIRQDSFGFEILASLSTQNNISFENYISYFENKKSRWSEYNLTIFEASNGVLYSIKNDSFDFIGDEKKAKTENKFLNDRGDCYGEKAERPTYQWILDLKNRICIGHTNSR